MSISAKKYQIKENQRKMDSREEEEESRDLGRGIRTYLEAKLECKCSTLSSRNRMKELEKENTYNKVYQN